MRWLGREGQLGSEAGGGNGREAAGANCPIPDSYASPHVSFLTKEGISLIIVSNADYGIFPHADVNLQGSLVVSHCCGLF